MGNETIKGLVNVVGELQQNGKPIATEEYVDGKVSDSNLEEITWSDLKTKRDNGELDPGKSYRITDYQCTTVQPETRSAGHVFDIIVTADSNAVLNENARACLHDGDTYFADSDLASWELKYSLDNDTDRFLWADGQGIVVGGNVYVRVPRWDRPGNTYGYGWGCAAMPMGHISITQLYTDTDAPTTSTKAYSSSTGGTEYAISSIHAEGGKGVIYRMRDEFNNEAPHDFKNIQYHVFGTEYMYTFGKTSSGAISDGSVTKHSYNNLITAYSSPFILNFVYTRNGMDDCTILGSREVIFKNNVDYGGHSMYVYASTNISFSTYETRCNRVINSYNCVLPGRFNIVIDSNSITQNGQMSSSNYYYDCHQMTLGNNCGSNKFIGTQSATLGASCSYNIFDGYAEHVTLGDNCRYNQFLGSLQYITLANNARQNIFNSGDEYITIGCQWLGYCVFDSNIKYLTVNATGTPSDASRVANYRFHPGILGASSSNPKVVTVSTLGADHSIDVYPIGSTEMFI